MDRKIRPSGSLSGITQQSLVMPNSDPRIDFLFALHSHERFLYYKRTRSTLWNKMGRVEFRKSAQYVTPFPKDRLRHVTIDKPRRWLSPCRYFHWFPVVLLLTRSLQEPWDFRYYYLYVLYDHRHEKTCFRGLRLHQVNKPMYWRLPRTPLLYSKSGVYAGIH